MPLYDYDCAACGRRFETIHGLHDDPPTVCPLCGSGPVRKAFAAPAVHFKGSGWAKKERRAKPASATASAGEGGDGSSESSSEAGSGTTKDAAKTPPAKSGTTGSSGSSDSATSSSTTADTD
jgi:putative FmdB family regulatory protein